MPSSLPVGYGFRRGRLTYHPHRLIEVFQPRADRLHERESRASIQAMLKGAKWKVVNTAIFLKGYMGDEVKVCESRVYCMLNLYYCNMDLATSKALGWFANPTDYLHSKKTITYMQIRVHDRTHVCDVSNWKSHTSNMIKVGDPSLWSPGKQIWHTVLENEDISCMKLYFMRLWDDSYSFGPGTIKYFTAAYSILHRSCSGFETNCVHLWDGI